MASSKTQSDIIPSKSPWPEGHRHSVFPNRATPRQLAITTAIQKTTQNDYAIKKRYGIIDGFNKFSGIAESWSEACEYMLDAPDAKLIILDNSQKLHDFQRHLRLMKSGITLRKRQARDSIETATGTATIEIEDDDEPIVIEEASPPSAHPNNQQQGRLQSSPIILNPRANSNRQPNAPVLPTMVPFSARRRLGRPLRSHAVRVLSPTQQSNWSGKRMSPTWPFRTTTIV